MRLIDADALVLNYDYCEDSTNCWKSIANAPTIDAVEVVRCAECKHNPKYTGNYMYGKCPYCVEDDLYAGAPDDDHYCSYGERKEQTKMKFSTAKRRTSKILDELAATYCADLRAMYQKGYERGHEDGYDEACMDLTDDDLGSEKGGD